MELVDDDDKIPGGPPRAQKRKASKSPELPVEAAAVAGSEEAVAPAAPLKKERKEKLTTCPPQQILSHINYSNPGQVGLLEYSLRQIAYCDANHDSIIEDNPLNKQVIQAGLPEGKRPLQDKTPIGEDQIVQLVAPGLAEFVRRGLESNKDVGTIDNLGIFDTQYPAAPARPGSAAIAPPVTFSRKYSAHRICLTGAPLPGRPDVRQTVTIADIVTFFKSVIGTDRRFGILYDSTNVSVEDILENTRLAEESKANPTTSDNTLPVYYPRETFYDPAGKFNIVLRDKFKKFAYGGKMISVIETPNQRSQRNGPVLYNPYTSSKDPTTLFYTKFHITMNSPDYNFKSGDCRVMTVFTKEMPQKGGSPPLFKEIYRASDLDANKEGAHIAYLSALEIAEKLDKASPKALEAKETASAAAQSKRIGDQGQGLSGLLLDERDWTLYERTSKDDTGEEGDGYQKDGSLCFGIPWSPDRPFLAFSLVIGNIFFYVFNVNNYGYGVLLVPEDLLGEVDPFFLEKEYIRNLQLLKEAAKLPPELEIPDAPQNYKTILDAYNAKIKVFLDGKRRRIEELFKAIPTPYNPEKKDSIQPLVEWIMSILEYYYCVTSNPILNEAAYPEELCSSAFNFYQALKEDIVADRYGDNEQLIYTAAQNLKLIQSFLSQYRFREATELQEETNQSLTNDIRSLLSTWMQPRGARGVSPFEIESVTRLFLQFREIRRNDNLVEYYKEILTFFSQSIDAAHKPVRHGELLQELDAIQGDTWSTSQEKEEMLVQAQAAREAQAQRAAAAAKRAVAEKLKELARQAKRLAKEKAKKERAEAAAAAKAKKEQEKEKEKQLRKKLKEAERAAKKLQKDPAMKRIFNRGNTVSKISKHGGIKAGQPIRRFRGGAKTFRLSRATRIVQSQTRRTHTPFSQHGSGLGNFLSIQQSDHNSVLDRKYRVNQYYERRILGHEIEDLLNTTVPTIKEIESDKEINAIPTHAVAFFYLYLTAIVRAKDQIKDKEPEEELSSNTYYFKLLRLEQFFLNILYTIQRNYRTFHESAEHIGKMYPSFKVHMYAYELFLAFIQLKNSKPEAVYYGLADECVQQIYGFIVHPDFSSLASDYGITGTTSRNLVKLTNETIIPILNKIREVTDAELLEKNTENANRRAGLFCERLQERLITEWLARFILHLGDHILDPDTDEAGVDPDTIYPEYTLDDGRRKPIQYRKTKDIEAEEEQAIMMDAAGYYREFLDEFNEKHKAWRKAQMRVNGNANNDDEDPPPPGSRYHEAVRYLGIVKGTPPRGPPKPGSEAASTVSGSHVRGIDSNVGSVDGLSGTGSHTSGSPREGARAPLPKQPNFGSENENSDENAKFMKPADTKRAKGDAPARPQELLATVEEEPYYNKMFVNEEGEEGEKGEVVMNLDKNPQPVPIRPMGLISPQALLMRRGVLRPSGSFTAVGGPAASAGPALLTQPQYEESESEEEAPPPPPPPFELPFTVTRRITGLSAYARGRLPFVPLSATLFRTIASLDVDSSHDVLLVFNRETLEQIRAALSISAHQHISPLFRPTQVGEINIEQSPYDQSIFSRIAPPDRKRKRKGSNEEDDVELEDRSGVARVAPIPIKTIQEVKPYAFDRYNYRQPLLRKKAVYSPIGALEEEEEEEDLNQGGLSENNSLEHVSARAAEALVSLKHSHVGNLNHSPVAAAMDNEGEGEGEAGLDEDEEGL
jgi:hypothetical protein